MYLFCKMATKNVQHIWCLLSWYPLNVHLFSGLTTQYWGDWVPGEGGLVHKVVPPTEYGLSLNMWAS